MAHAFAALDELGDGYGFRVRKPLGVNAFGVNAIVYLPGYEGFHHFHDTQDELYFVHSGLARMEADGEARPRPRWTDARRVDDSPEGVERERRPTTS